MAINIQQAWQGVDLSLESGSGNTTDSNATIYYIVSGTTDDAEACMSAWSFSNATYLGMERKSVAIGERLTDDSWKIEVHYGGNDDTNDDALIESGSGNSNLKMSFDCSTGTTHIVRSFKQTRWKNEPNPGGMIGWNGKFGQDAEYAGVDIVTASMRESYTIQMAQSQLTTAYKRAIFNTTGKVNSNSFKGWEAGEVLFMGASFADNADGQTIAVTFNFAIQQNEKAAQVSDNLSINKRGWDYLWTLTKTVDDPATRTTKVEIINAYVEQVYPYTDFGKLKL